MTSKNNINSVFTDIANSIRAKKGTTNPIQPINMAEEIDGIPTGIIPSGKIEITNTEEINVTNYATAQIVDSNLVAENIKEGISILGKVGTYKGGSSEDRFKKFLDTTKSTSYLFYYYKGTSIDDLFQYSDTENVTNMEHMFQFCSNLQTIPQLNTSKVTNMSYMFNGCSKLQTIPQLDTSKVTYMERMFQSCSNLQATPQLDTSNVNNMSYMLYGCSKLQTIPQLDTSNVISMNGIFRDCQNLQTIPQLDTSKISGMDEMFSNCYLLPKIDITSMDKITYSSSTSYTFYNCYSLTKLIIRTMTKIPVLNSNAFNGCYHFSGTTDSIYNPEGLKDGRIYVPDNMVDSLKQKTNWSAYADIIVPLSTLVE